MRELSAHALGAKSLRADLKKAFPGVKFSVTSSSFSMGDSIGVSWDNGPRVAEVEAISDRYQYGDFDGMDDSYNHRRGFDESRGSAKFVQTNRHFSESLREQIGRDLCKVSGVEFEGLGFKTYIKLSETEILAIDTITHRMLYPVSFVGRGYQGVEWDSAGQEYKAILK